MTKTAMQIDDLAGQINELAGFITEEIPGEPSQNEGAIECAIRIMREQRKAINRLQDLTERLSARDGQTLPEERNTMKVGELIESLQNMVARGTTTADSEVLIMAHRSRPAEYRLLGVCTRGECMWMSGLQDLDSKADALSQNVFLVTGKHLGPGTKVAWKVA